VAFGPAIQECGQENHKYASAVLLIRGGPIRSRCPLPLWVQRVCWFSGPQHFSVPRNYWLKNVISGELRKSGGLNHSRCGPAQGRQYFPAWCRHWWPIGRFVGVPRNFGRETRNRNQTRGHQVIHEMATPKRCEPTGADNGSPMYASITSDCATVQPVQRSSCLFRPRYAFADYTGEVWMLSCFRVVDRSGTSGYLSTGS
jgi:hypothetical protein